MEVWGIHLQCNDNQLTFHQPAHPTTYNYTLKINKTSINLNSSVFISNCSLYHNEDKCEFTFPMSSQISCIVAEIQQGSESRPYVHGIVKLSSRQGNTLAGIITFFVIIIIILVIIIIIILISVFVCV